MRVLVTGSEGFVGKATCELLVGLGHEVFRYDLARGHDIRDKRWLQQCVGVWMPTHILHLAAIARFSDADQNPKLTCEINIDGTRNVVEVAKFNHLPLVFASTGSVYMPIEGEMPITESHPVRGNSVYGCTKAIAEAYVREHTQHIILRYAHLYGAGKRGHGLVGGCIERLKIGKPPILFGGEQTNDMTYIDDVVRANILALTAQDTWNQTFNIGTGLETSALWVAQRICLAMGRQAFVETRPARPVDPPRFVYDMTKAETILGFRASFDVDAGLQAMLLELQGGWSLPPTDGGEVVRTPSLSAASPHQDW